MSPEDRARKYLAEMPPAISGQNGHGQTLQAACALVWGFDLPEANAWPLLLEYNERCQPPWSEKELRHKISEAGRITTHQKPRGHLLGSISFRMPRSEPAKPDAALPLESVRVVDVSNLDTLSLPGPLDNPTRRLLMEAFREGERICIAQEGLGASGEPCPKNAGVLLTREEWLAKLESVDGDPNRIWSTTERTGAFIRVNPGGSKDADITAFRHALLEFDEGDLPEQYSTIKRSNVPCAAIIYSGGKSIHAWVRVDAKDRREYDERVRALYERLSPDPKNKNPSRLSRLPGMIRGDKRQELLELRCGAESWDKWSPPEAGKDGLPDIEDAADLLEREEPLPVEVVYGVAYQGDKISVGGGSKSNKTWVLLDLALSVAYGEPWLSQKVTRGRVLYLNFEIRTSLFTRRIKHVAKAKGITMAGGNLEVWNLRGHAASYSALIPKIAARAQDRGYRLIIIDPTYKLLGDSDENKAGDIARLMNEFETLAQKSGAAIAFGAHFSKGSQAGKESIDRISGSGVFARDPDTIMTLTPLEAENSFKAELTLRNFKPMAPFGVRFDFPIMRRDDDLDLSKLKQSKGRPPKYTPSHLLAVLGAEALTVTAWQKATSDETGMTKSTFYELYPALVKAKSVTKKEDGKWQKSEKSEKSD
jgi:RecA-family ATPase